MPVVIKEINSLLETLEAEDYTSVLDYVKLVSQNRKRQRALETIAAMNEFQSALNGEKGWKNEEEMLKDMADFRRKRLGKA